MVIDVAGALFTAGKKISILSIIIIIIVVDCAE